MKSEREVFDVWVTINGWHKSDPITDEGYIKAMSGTLSFQMYLLKYRMRECFESIFSKN